MRKFNGNDEDSVTWLNEFIDQCNLVPTPLNVIIQMVRKNLGRAHQGWIDTVRLQGSYTGHFDLDNLSRNPLVILCSLYFGLAIFLRATFPSRFCKDTLSELAVADGPMSTNVNKTCNEFMSRVNVCRRFLGAERIAEARQKIIFAFIASMPQYLRVPL
jgi:hypothetical protein